MSAGANGQKPAKGGGLLSRIFSGFVFRLLTSFLLAVLVWLVINAFAVNPPDTVTLYPTLTQLNRTSLENKGLVLKTESIQSTVAIRLSGRQEDLAALRHDEYEAVIDFAEVTGEGNTNLAVVLRSANTENVSVVGIEPAEIPIEVERRTIKTFEIQVNVTGDTAEGFILTGYTPLQTTKSFSELESLIEQIDRVEVTVDVADLRGNTVFHQQCRVYDHNGEEMHFVRWEQVIDVSVEVSKEVPVVANVIGTPASDWYARYTTTTPETVRINGTREALEKVDSLYTDALDIAQVRQSVSREMALVLPSNVKMSLGDPSKVLVDVTVHQYQYSQDYSLLKSRVEVLNARSSYRYEIIEPETRLLLKGRVESLADLTSEGVGAIVNVEGLPPGTHAVSAILNLPEHIFSVNDIMLTVVVAGTSGGGGGAGTGAPAASIAPTSAATEAAAADTTATDSGADAGDAAGPDTGDTADITTSAAATTVQDDSTVVAATTVPEDNAVVTPRPNGRTPRPAQTPRTQTSGQ